MAADLDPVADELYALPRDEFTAARNAAAKRARQNGDKTLAEQIQALRRPSTAAWLANLLSREHPDEVRALVVDLGDGLRAAQDQLEGEALRRLSQQRHEVVHGLVEQARALARSTGNPPSDAVTRELENTFTAAVNSSTAAEAVAGGRLTSALDPAEAGGLLGTTTTPPPAKQHGDDGPKREERLRRDLEQARSTAADADAARDKAERELTDAESAADDAAATLRELRSHIEAVEQAEHDTRTRARSAEREVDAADRAAREAQRRVLDLERRLDQH
ncbi:hypothetical protein GCM10010464_05620 [Pseudonocardia yunnanensis]|uniref:Transposase n=1 Tax=Pseudonocardia yunnanensis TaxID=58107 RepID=A0ABW4EYI2_9PSEU